MNTRAHDPWTTIHRTASHRLARGHRASPIDIADSVEHSGCSYSALIGRHDQLAIAIAIARTLRTPICHRRMSIQLDTN
jgi:hypothetical protein